MASLIKCAINTRVINKPNPDDKAAWKSLASEWTNVEWTVEQLAAHVNKGHSICAQMLKRRTNANFMGSRLIPVDLDDNCNLTEILNRDYVKQMAAMVYTTPSHTDDHHRLRVVFVADRDIIDPVEMRAALTGVIRKFGGDQACKDVCRLFFGSKGSNPIILGNVLPSAELDKLIKLGSEQRVSDSDGDSDDSARRAPVGNRSNVTLAWDQCVRLSKGGTVPLQSLDKRTAVFCPVHEDIRHASAMVVVNKEDKRGVYCSKCASTYWPADPRRAKRQRYDFNLVPNLVRELASMHPASTGDDGAAAGGGA